MRTYGIKSSGLLIVLVFLQNIANSQSNINPCLCNRKECGDIVASFKLVSNSTVVCDGYEFEVQNNSTIPDVSYYIWSWGDGTRDSVTTTANQKHIYNIPSDKVCTDNQTTYQICLLAVKRCGSGFSCHNNNSPVTVIHRPVAKFDYTQTVCRDKVVNFTNRSCNVDKQIAGAYLWTFHDGTTSTSENTSKTYTAPGTYNVKLKVKNGCSEHEITQVINVVDFPNAVVNISAEAQDSIVCVGDTIMLINKSNQWSSISWVFPGSNTQSKNVLNDTSFWKLDPSIRKLEKRFPIDTLIYLDTIKFIVIQANPALRFRMVSTNVCGTASWSWNLKVLDIPNVTLQSPTQFCERADYTPTISVPNDSLTYQWSFPGGSPATFSGKNPGTIKYEQPGNYEVTLEVTGVCNTIVRKVNVVVNSRNPVKITDPMKVFCKNGGPDTLKVDRAGGMWSGPGIVNTSIGIFNPGNLNPGKHEIVYTIGPAGCQSIDRIMVEVVNSAVVTASDKTFCENEASTQLTANPPGGLWSGSAALSSAGIFNPLVSKIGSFDVTYTYRDFNQCVTQKTARIIVEPKPILTTKDTVLLCSGTGMADLQSSLQVIATPTGGSFKYLIDSIDIGKNLDLSKYKNQVLTIEIVYERNACTVKDSSRVSFTDPPVVVITQDTSICINDSIFRLSSNVNNGLWSGQGINVNTGVVNLNLAGSGVKTYTYTYQPNTSCVQERTVQLNIKDLNIGLNAGVDTSICERNGILSLSGFSPAGGQWYGTGIDSITGAIDLAKLKRDSIYSFSYRLQDASISGCQASDSRSFIIRSLPKTDFIVTGLSCAGENLTIINNTSGNNVLKFDLGDGTISTKDSLVHAYINKGVYTINLAATNVFGCTNNISKQVDISTKAVPAINIADKEGCAPFILDVRNNSTGDNISYEWLVNGQSYNVPELPKIKLDSITSDSTFIIQLSVSNTCGTVITKDSVKVHPYPIVNFGVKELQGCSPFNVIFSNISAGNPTQYIWDMGNGVILNDVKPANQNYFTTRDSVSTYSILLIGTNSCGTDSIRKSITVYPPDVNAFIQTPGFNLCQYDTLLLEAFSTKGAINTWKFITPDGSQLGASGDKAIIKVDQSGTYTAILYASRCGTDTDTIQIKVNPAPTVNFISPSISCVGTKVVFDNKSINVAGAMWDFGNGQTSNATNGEVIFMNPGTYTIRLTAYSILNNCPYTFEKPIKVSDLPVANFIPSTLSGCEPLEISFNNISSGGKTYEWSFSDSSSNSIALSPTHIFRKPGTFPVKLTVYNDNGCSADTSILNIIVHPQAKSAFEADKNIYCFNNDTIKLINKSIASSGQLWTIANETFNTKDLNWLPKDIGEVTVKLNTFSTFGCKDSIIKNVKVLPSPVSLFNTDNDRGCEDLKVKFLNYSKHTDKYVWDFGNGTKSVEKDPVYTFTTPGDFNVKLIALNNNGCPNDTFVQSIQVFAMPKADFILKKEAVCGVPSRVSFNNLSSSNVENIWSVSGNVVSKDLNHTSIFSAAGKYNILLTVKSENLCSDSVMKSIDIYQQPVAAFEFKPKACEGETLVLKNNSINAVQYEWDIQGKGKTSKAEPEILFDKAGSYQIQLIAIYNEFCKDTFKTSAPVEIYKKPKADFDYSTNFDDKVIGEVLFKNASKDYNSSFWNFGDGFTSTEENPTHEYDVNRDIIVKLQVNNTNNGLYVCTDSITKIIAPEWITTFYAPTALSPEYGDGDVRVFKPVGTGLLKYDISIFSPWGEKVWQSDKLIDNAPSEVWDGSYKNAIVPQGAYSWIADVTFLSGVRKVYRGSVTVLR